MSSKFSVNHRKSSAFFNPSGIPTPYEDLLLKVYTQGEYRPDRTGTGTLSLFGQQMTFNLVESFPLITTKKVPLRLVAEELFWFLSGNTNINPLRDKNVHIWDEWAQENGELGPVYGHQWRFWQGIDGKTHDQISDVVEGIRSNPFSRRHVVSAWNVGELDEMALQPCHVMFQFYVSVDGTLSCHLYQRSADMFLGVPFNIASYALLTHMVAQQTGYVPGKLIWSGGDCHIYTNHLEQVETQLSRSPRKYPTLSLTRAESIFGYTMDNITLEGYDPHPTLKGDVAV